MEEHPEVEAVLKSLMQEEIIIREHQIDYDAQTADEDFDALSRREHVLFQYGYASVLAIHPISRLS